MTTRARLQSLAGIAGPVAFIAAWSILGLRRAGYSPVHDPISRLAAVDAPMRAVMTAGFLAFGAGVGLYAPQLRRVAGGSAVAAAVTAAATVGIAATPLGGSLGDGPHAVAAGIAYTALAATPLLAVRKLHATGHPALSATSAATGLAIGALLAASAILPQGTGLAQRAGLTLGDAWIIASAIAMTRRPAWDRPVG